MAELPESLLSRVEDAGLNASAPPQQRWVDGWIVRFSPGKAKRARCINAVATGRLPVSVRLAHCEAVLREAGLPVFVRITPFSQPPELDHRLDEQGYARIDRTRVMVHPDFPTAAEALPPELQLALATAADFAEVVGDLRGSPVEQRRAQAQRVGLSPVPFQGWVLRRRDDQAIVACAQVAVEAELVGLYDVFTQPQSRGQGLARLLCGHLLARASQAGSRVAYLQVDAGNAPAQAVYRRLGFRDAYGYHYRTPDAGAH
jgi:ribosomal protein S18 acetylase RimI-like enzyme